MGKTLCFPASARNVGSDAEMRPWNMALIHASMSTLNERFDPKPVPKELRDKIAALRERLDAVNRAAQAEQDWRKQTALARESQTLADELNKLLPQVDQYELRVANALWGEKTYPFQPSYMETIHRFYRSGGAFPADFKGNAEGERQKINAWVEDQTNKRIRDLIPPGCLDEQTRLVLTNAIYFKGQWSEPFEEAQPWRRISWLRRGISGVPMMHKEYMNAARYGAFSPDGTPFPTPRMVPFDREPAPETLYPGKGGFLMAELPYKGGDLSMVVIVPQEADGLPTLEKKLSSVNIQAWTGRLERREVHVHLPKFKLETDYQMNEPLKALGMVRAFADPRQSNGAQFEGMCASQDPELRLYIAAVLHKAFVDVNEKGTEAAAATAVAMAAGAAMPRSVPFIPTFRADKPFIFAIRDVKTGTILFLGRVTNPRG